jgi:O-antigen/teichoic acid export membrane protein
MTIGKKDIVWAYAAQFFQIAAGILILPLILRLLNADEIAMYYLMLNIGALVILFDFGFSGQFSRNFSYVFSGAQELKQDGLAIVEKKTDINYHLLKTLIRTSQTVYRIISLFVLLAMFSAGTWYIYKATNGFTQVPYALVIWILYSISTFFNIYYLYLNCLLTGKGAIAESRKSTVYSRIVYIAVACILLLSKCGLLSLVAANLIAPFIQRLLSIKYFYTIDMKKSLKQHNVNKQDLANCFRSVWHNAKKMGLVSLGSAAINKSGMFFAGLYLSSADIASYGLMSQLTGVAVGISTTMFTIHQPIFAECRINNNFKKLLKDFALTMGFFYFMFLVFSLFLIFCGNPVLSLIKSNVFLPVVSVVIIYLIVALLEQNHSLFGTFIVIGNNIPFVKASLIAGLFIVLGTYAVLNYLRIGVIGLVIVPGIVQIVYANWKWPLVVCREMQVSFRGFLKISLYEMLQYSKRGIDGINRFFKK